MSRFVLLDRDGVINHDSDKFIKSPEEWIAIDQSLDAIALLNQHHFQVVIISNQSGIARGYFSQPILEAIHEKMRIEVAKVGGIIEAIYSCPHQASDQCDCRKPKAGLLLQFAKEYNVNLSDVSFIGDSWRDIQAAQVVNANPILVKTGNGLKTLHDNVERLTSISIFENVYDAAKFLISRSST